MEQNVNEMYEEWKKTPEAAQQKDVVQAIFDAMVKEQLELKGEPWSFVYRTAINGVMLVDNVNILTKAGMIGEGFGQLLVAAAYSHVTVMMKNMAEAVNIKFTQDEFADLMTEVEGKVHSIMENIVLKDKKH
jgi:hypothetical protein